MHSRAVETLQVRRAQLEFVEAPPCQVDGEALEGTSFSIDVVPAALSVIFP